MSYVCLLARIGISQLMWDNGGSVDGRITVLSISSTRVAGLYTEWILKLLVVHFY